MLPQDQINLNLQTHAQEILLLSHRKEPADEVTNTNKRKHITFYTLLKKIYLNSTNAVCFHGVPPACTVQHVKHVPVYMYTGML